MKQEIAKNVQAAVSSPGTAVNTHGKVKCTWRGHGTSILVYRHEISMHARGKLDIIFIRDTRRYTAPRYIDTCRYVSNMRG